MWEFPLLCLCVEAKDKAVTMKWVINHWTL